MAAGGPVVFLASPGGPAFLDLILVTLLNGLSAGLLLFMLSAGLTLVFSMMGVLNFAHGGFYLLGAYVAQALSTPLGFWPALLLAPVGVGLLGAGFEAGVLRRVQRAAPAAGHLPALLITFGLGLVIVEAAQLGWGRAPLVFEPPALLQGAAFTLRQSAADGLQWLPGAAPEAACQAASCAQFPRTRAFMMGVALAMLALQWALLRRSRIGLVIQAALTHPDTVSALGHDLPRITTAVFGCGAALAALAGVIGGVTFVTEPGMAGSVGAIVFVVLVVGGLGSLAGALLASLGIGLLQTLPLAVDASLADLVRQLGGTVGPATPGWPLLRITLAHAAPLLPYALLVLMLVLRPRGLLGRRDG